MNKKIFPIYTDVSNNPITICMTIDHGVFDYPFFNDGVIKERDYSLKEERYTLDSIELEFEDLLEIKGFIFHTSHCGSTLMSRMLNESPEIRVVSETEAINGLLLSYVLNQKKEEVVLLQLKKIINAYRQPLNQEKYLIFKLSSWNIYMANLFQKLYPKVRWLYIDRNTSEVVQSLLKSEGGMESWYYHANDSLRKYFVDNNYSGGNKESYLIHLVEQHRKQAKAFKNEMACFLNYPNFINSFSSQVLPHFGLKVSQEDRIKMENISLFEAKSNIKIPFKKG